jgi:hypothetical protein
MSFVYFYKIRELEGRTGSVWGIDTCGRGEDVEKGYERVYMIQILCTHVM